MHPSHVQCIERGFSIIPPKSFWDPWNPWSPTEISDTPLKPPEKPLRPPETTLKAPRNHLKPWQVPVTILWFSWNLLKRLKSSETSRPIIMPWNPLKTPWNFLNMHEMSLKPPKRSWNLVEPSWKLVLS